MFILAVKSGMLPLAHVGIDLLVDSASCHLRSCSIWFFCDGSNYKTRRLLLELKLPCCNNCDSGLRELLLAEIVVARGVSFEAFVQMHHLNSVRSGSK